MYQVPIPFLSRSGCTAGTERETDINMDAVRAYEEVIKDNIEYPYLIRGQVR